MQHNVGKTHQSCNNELQALLFQGPEGCPPACCQYLAVTQGEDWLSSTSGAWQWGLQGTFILSPVHSETFCAPTPSGRPQPFFTLITDESVNKACCQSPVQRSVGFALASRTSVHIVCPPRNACSRQACPLTSFCPLSFHPVAACSPRPSLSVPALAASAVHAVHFLMVFPEPWVVLVNCFYLSYTSGSMLCWVLKRGALSKPLVSL